MSAVICFCLKVFVSSGDECLVRLEAVKVVFLIFFKAVIFLCSVIEERQEEAGSGACSVCKGGAERKAPLRSLNCMTFIQTERVCVCVCVNFTELELSFGLQSRCCTSVLYNSEQSSHKPH